MRLYVNRLGHGHTNVFQRRWTCVIVRHRAITRATAVTNTRNLETVYLDYELRSIT